MTARSPDSRDLHVVIVGGGFAGVGCARRLARSDRVRVTLIDRNNYHQFQPLLYQVATSQVAPSHIAFSLRKLFRNDPNVTIKLADVVSVDAENLRVVTADGAVHSGDAVVVAAGAVPNFFGTPGAADHAFPLYSLEDADSLRTRIITVFEEADRDPTVIDHGALNFVVVGGGPTGVETAGSLADLIRDTMTVEYPGVPVAKARIHLVDVGDALLTPFSENAHHYAARVLTQRGVELHLGVRVTDVGPGHVTLSDGTTIKTRCVVWGGGNMAPPLAGEVGATQSRGGRIDVLPDLTVEGRPGLYAIGDIANIPSPYGILPQLGSVAMQSGVWAAENLIADAEGRPRTPFQYRDKGIMAMIGRGSAIAAGPRRRELRGLPAFAAWLGVHAALLTGARNRSQTFVDWGFDYFARSRGPQILDRSAVTPIDWSDTAPPAPAGDTPDAAAAPETPTAAGAQADGPAPARAVP
jgi:NADH:ubiquinone reductase (H+-translocating)